MGMRNEDKSKATLNATHLHSDVELSFVRSALLLDWEPSLLDLAPNKGRRWEGDRADEFGVGVVLVPHFKDQLLSKVAHLDAVFFIPLRVQVVEYNTGKNT